MSLVSYELCPAGTKNVLNETLGYFQCQRCTDGYYSTIEEAFTCTLCLSGSVAEQREAGNVDCTLCSNRVPGSTSTFDGASSVSDCVCEALTYYNGRKGDSGECVSCVGMRGVDCTEAGMSLETLRVKPGFWRTGPLSTDVKRCYNPEACIGANATAAIDAGIDGVVSDSAAHNGTHYCDVG